MPGPARADASACRPPRAAWRRARFRGPHRAIEIVIGSSEPRTTWRIEAILTPAIQAILGFFERPLLADLGQSAPTLIVRHAESSALRTLHFILGAGFDVAARHVVLGSSHCLQERHLRAARSAHRPEPEVVEARASTSCGAGRSLERPLEYQVLSTRYDVDRFALACRPSRSGRSPTSEIGPEADLLRQDTLALCLSRHRSPLAVYRALRHSAKMQRISEILQFSVIVEPRWPLSLDLQPL